MIDIHSHILPGIDDGARDLAEALALARAYVADGVTQVVATPHIYPGVFDNTPDTVGAAFDLLQEALVREGIPLRLSRGAEVRVSEELPELVLRQQLLFLDSGQREMRHVLLELPDGQIPVGTDRLVDWLLQRQIRPVLAHPERNKAVMADPLKMRPFVTRGCRLQVTAGAVLGQFGDKAQRAARALLDQGWVTAVASDAHNLIARAPRMTPARAWLVSQYGERAAEVLTLEGPTLLCA
jgi:tyrosine-protein phosphatase YwqE